MVSFIMTGKIMGGENMVELVQNRQFFPVIILTVTSASQIFFLNLKRIYSFLSVPDAFASTMINDDICVFIVKLNILFSLSLYILRSTVMCATK